MHRPRRGVAVKGEATSAPRHGSWGGGEAPHGLKTPGATPRREWWPGSGNRSSPHRSGGVFGPPHPRGSGGELTLPSRAPSPPPISPRFLPPRDRRRGFEPRRALPGGPFLSGALSPGPRSATGEA